MTFRKNKNIDTSLLESIVVGRVEPHIYAFSTQTVPNYLKVGDTYRPVEKRLSEWRMHYPDLKKQFSTPAKVNDETFFRDYSAHQYLENDIQKERLKPGDKKIKHYSNEFFKDITRKDVSDAVKDIKLSYEKNTKKYKYYKFEDSLIPITHTYERKESYQLRPNQQETVKRFKEAISKGRTNLLMYAVMRFGKSFTSLCCALEMNAKFVVVVSAKADVKEEWKKTAESHRKFKGYKFLDSEALLQSNDVISKTLTKKKIILFLTLQDLQGEEIKKKHRELFGGKASLLIVDETHFGARATEYGKVIKDQHFTKKEINQESKLNEIGIEEVDKITKTINAKIKLHLSGTPYRILMGSEFKREDIIAFYQFSNIADDQKKWDESNLSKDKALEWENPYYGFPQMIRFAFNPNKSSRKKMEDLRNQGISYTFSELFRPLSVTKDNSKGLHKKFKFENEVTDLFKAIDGTKNEEDLLSFLDYEKIKEGKMCNHIVCVLPYRASCDALECLLNSKKFKNLNKYKIINISGVENEKVFKDTLSVKNKILELEKKNKKTITLTVNRMLTGSTVPQWDTMLFLKDTASPQEYDQAIFRLQNQYVKNYKDANGDTLKFNMKPQTLLVDFNPNRMFRMQEHKAQIYNVNTDTNGNLKLEKRIQKELGISPIVTINKNKIVQVEPNDILDIVRDYSNKRSVVDEATSISIDMSLLEIDEIKSEIEKQNKIGSRKGLESEPLKGEGYDLDVESGVKGEEVAQTSSAGSTDVSEENQYKDKFAMYYARILFFALLTDSKVKSLEEIVQTMQKGPNNTRISKNIELQKSILEMFIQHINPFVLSELDYKIQNINFLSNDKSIEPINRAGNALRKFGRLSESEVVTPAVLSNQLVSGLKNKKISKKDKIIDVASKQGEFVYAVYTILGKEKARNLYSVPTSKIAYEFTRKVYDLLDLNINHIENKYTAEEIITNEKLKKISSVKINNKFMKFDVVIGNPPYQVKDGGARASAKPIYNLFVDFAKEMNPKYISIIMPTRWYVGGKGLDRFRNEMLNDKRISELHDFLNPNLIFPNENLRGGVCYFLWEDDYDNTKKKTKFFSYKNDFSPKLNLRSLKVPGFDILIRHEQAIKILEKIISHTNFESLEEHTSSRKPFGLDSNIVKKPGIFKESKDTSTDVVKCIGKAQKVGYIDRSAITKNTDWIDRYKVFNPYSNNIGTELNDDNLNSFVGNPKTVSTETYLVVGYDLNLNKESASNLSRYLQTRFVRFAHGQHKASQHGTSKTYKFVPVQDFTNKSDINWKKTIDEIDKQLYAKYKLSKKQVTFIEEIIKEMK